jgi:hypothetical protein
MTTADSHARTEPFDVVVLGASSGGHAAVAAVLQALPAEFATPIVVMLRLAPDALSYRRYQLAARPLVALFHEVCQPLATETTPDAFLFGLRLMAIDGTVEDVADTAGRPSTVHAAPEVHRAVSVRARMANKSLNSYVNDLLEQCLRQAGRQRCKQAWYNEHHDATGSSDSYAASKQIRFGCHLRGAQPGSVWLAGARRSDRPERRRPASRV